MNTLSLRLRLIFWVVALLMGMWGLSAGIAAYVLYNENNEILDDGLRQTAERLLPLVTELVGDDSDHDRELAIPPEHSHYIVWRLTNAQGRELMLSDNGIIRQWPAPGATGFSNDPGGWRIYTLRSATGDVTLQAAEDLRHRYEGFTESVSALTLPLMLLLPLAAMAAWVIVTRGLGSLARLGAELSARGRGNLAAIGHTHFPAELHPLVEETNRMMDRLSRAMEAERSMAANSAHELRTPVAAAQAQAQLLADELKESPASPRASQLAGALQRLSRLVEKLLQLARADAGVALARETVDLAELARFLAREAGRRHPGHPLKLIGAESPVFVKGDADMIGVALQNLIDNAFLHGSTGEPVELRLGPGPVVEVRNGGPVIPAPTLATLTRRFTRAASPAPGTGLGLSIVAAVASQSGASLSLASPAPGSPHGFSASLTFPA